jgi:hypothetical protein
MLEAVALVVGAVVLWILADHGITWLRERQHRGPSSWHGRGPGQPFHSTGFEDTLPPHEARDTRVRLTARQQR